MASAVVRKQNKIVKKRVLRNNKKNLVFKSTVAYHVNLYSVSSPQVFEKGRCHYKLTFS